MLIGTYAKTEVIERNGLPAHHTNVPELQQWQIQQWRRFRSHLL